jgi:hypothetical protein
MIDMRPHTIFCDIDGTLVVHEPPSVTSNPDHEMVLLSGTIGKLMEWDRLGYRIILTTGRKESMREATVKQLSACGIFYDQLIMGIGGGKRILINDRKPSNDCDYALSINLPRNTGIGNVIL